MRRIGLGLALLLVAFAALPALASAKGGKGSRLAADHALQEVKDLKKGIGVRTGRELTPALAELAARKGDLDTAGKKEAATFLARPTDSNDSDYYGNSFIADVQSFCPGSSIYCFHWVADAGSGDAPDLTDSGGAAGVPDYIETMAASFNEVHGCENGTAAAACAQGAGAGMGWQEPIPDGSTGGGSNKFDVYV